MARDKKPTNCLSQAWRANLPDHVIDVQWSAYGGHLVTGTANGQIQVFDASSGNLQCELAGHPPGLASLAVHPLNVSLASCGHDGKVRVWLASGGEIWDWDAGASWAERVAWSRSGESMLIAAAAGKIVRIRDVGSGETLREFGPFPSTVADIAWQPGKNILAVAYYGGVNLYSPDDGDPIALWPYKGSPLKLAWSPDGKMLAHGNQDASVHFRYAETGAELHMSGYPTKVRELSWDFRGRYLATGGGPGVCVWDCAGKGPEGSTPRILEGHSGNVSAVAWQHRGFLLASTDVEGRLAVWQTANRTPLIGGATFSDTELTCLAWSPDDKALAVGTSAGVLAVFKVN